MWTIPTIYFGELFCDAGCRYCHFAPGGMWDSGYQWYQYKQGEIGLYWSSTCADVNGAMSFQVWSAQVKMEWNNKSNKCCPVRLVKNVE